MFFYSLWYFLFLMCISVIIQKSKKNSNTSIYLLLVASVLFYASNSLISLFLLAFIVVIAYFAGIIVDNSHSRIKLAVSLLLIFLPLFVYKYLNALVESIGLGQIDIFMTLPVGISFYTLTAAGYVIDIYKKKIKHEPDFRYLSAFITLFCYYGGPIERADNILEQLKNASRSEINENQVCKGLCQLLRGCFMKVYVAETIAVLVNEVYSDISSSYGLSILVATVLFGVQLYCDFEGYSLMAQGSANVLNISITSNFRQPYFSVSVTDFWRRWHISLSGWFREYVYFPLGGSRCGIIRRNINLMITFLLSGIWHGANWTFVIWGAVNAIYMIVEGSIGLKAVNKKGAKGVLGRIYTWLLINFSWIFFRAKSGNDAFYAVKKIFMSIPREIASILSGKASLSSILNLNISTVYLYSHIVLGVILVTVIDCYQYVKGPLEDNVGKWPKKLVFLCYFGIALLLMIFGVWTTSSNFIYLGF